MVGVEGGDGEAVLGDLQAGQRGFVQGKTSEMPGNRGRRRTRRAAQTGERPPTLNQRDGLRQERQGVS